LKVAILGAGGIGGFMGGALARSGEDVSVIARGSHLQAIRDRGLTVESISLGNFQSKVRATDRPSDVGAVDLVLFCVKAYDTETALESIGPLIGGDTAVLSFQNGVDNEEKIARVVGNARVLGGAISVESFIAEPGLIKQPWGPVKMAMGELSGNITPRAKKIHTALMNAGLKCELSSRIQEILWEKFLFICPIGGICSVARASVGDVLDFEQIRDFYVGALKETEAVARAAGINLAGDIGTQTLAQAGRANKSTKPSMLRDLERGKRIEVDALSGAVSRLGRQFSVPTPINDFIFAALKIHDLKAMKTTSRPVPS
jgi:2-dehydropantoate 2-reductase